MTDSCCDPSPNTGASPVRANLKTLRTSRSHSPYTVGGRTMVHEPAIVRTSCSAASLLWPYGLTGDGGRVSSIGFPGRVGPAAACAQGPHQMRTDETRAAGDERLHRGLS